MPTARFVHFACADENNRVVIFGGSAIDQALRARRWLAAHDADGGQFVDMFGLRHQERHRSEWLAAKIGIESGDDDAHAAIRELIGDIGNFPIEELRFVDGDDSRLRIESFEDLSGSLNRNRAAVCAAVRRDLAFAVPRVEAVRKNLDARRMRRMSSSVLPENIEPQMSSM